MGGWPFGRGGAERRGRRWPLITLIVVVVLVVVGRLAAPSLVERVVEKSLEDMPGGYQGTLEGVDIRTFDAEIALVGLQIQKKNGQVPVPFLKTRELVIGTVRDSWRPRTTLRLVGPVMSYVDAPSPAGDQFGPKMDLAQIRKQLPFELIGVYIEDGEVHFRNFRAKPEIDAYASGLNVRWEKLVGCMPPGSSACRSELRGEASLMKGGRLALNGRFERRPEALFDLQATVKNLSARSLSPLLKEYAKVDVQKGSIELDAHYKRQGKAQSALITPRLDDFEVMGSDSKDTRFFRELGVAAAAGWFERKRGEKAIALHTKSDGGLGFKIVDAPKSSADTQTR